jgi:hypothetical protein
MANSRICTPCSKGSNKNCQKRFAAPSNRTELTHGQQPRRPLYSYKCPNAPKS